MLFHWPRALTPFGLLFTVPALTFAALSLGILAMAAATVVPVLGVATSPTSAARKGVRSR
jgi:hypothetical protein